MATMLSIWVSAMQDDGWVNWSEEVELQLGYLCEWLTLFVDEISVLFAIPAFLLVRSLFLADFCCAGSLEYISTITDASDNPASASASQRLR